MNDTIALVGCLAVLAIGVGVLQWGYRQVGTFRLFKLIEAANLKVGSVYNLNTNGLKFNNVELVETSYKRVLMDNWEMGYEVTNKFRTRHDMTAISCRDK